MNLEIGSGLISKGLYPACICRHGSRMMCRASLEELQPNGESAWVVWEKLRETAPLTQCITNYVSMDIMANGLLAAGCSPAMVGDACLMITCT